jgi:flavin-dependent dehydrogenase
MAGTAFDPGGAATPGGDFRLVDGSRVGVVGGGPAGSFFAYFLLQMAQRAGIKPEVEIFEPRDFSVQGPRGCNMCGGIISETLAQAMAAEGLEIPVSVLQRRIDSYTLHMDVGSVRIETPRHEKRIAAVHRGGGPRGFHEIHCDSFDGYLLDRALQSGAGRHAEMADHLGMRDGRPVVRTRNGNEHHYDLLAVAIGVNATSLKLLQKSDLQFRPPRSTQAFVCEFHLGLEMTKRYLGSSMHVFLIDLPRVEFAAIIPKSDYATVCILGHDIDKDLVQNFLTSPEVRNAMPPHWQVPEDFCHCSPRMNVGGSPQPFSNRVVFVGDCGETRLYKDGIGAAYRTAKAAAVTAVFQGVGSADFKKYFQPTCKSIGADNRIGRVVFHITSQIKRRRFARRGVWRMVSKEQRGEGGKRHMSTVLWDTFTGSAPYKEIFLRSLHPGFLSRFTWEMASGLLPEKKVRTKGRIPMVTGALGRIFKDGDIIYRQGELGDCMYVIQTGQVEVLQRKGDKEFCLATLGKGDFFGEMALFKEEERPATVRSVGKTTVMVARLPAAAEDVDPHPRAGDRPGGFE